MKSMILIFIAIIASACLIAQTAIAPSVGDGTINDPYEISTLENLYWIAADNDVVPDPDQAARWSSHYIQTANIDASDTTNWFDEQGWSPIGYHYTEDLEFPFSGSYSGSNFTIDGLFINRRVTSSIGLFGFTSGASLENIGLTNVSIIGGTNVGALSGYNLGSITINGCHSSGSIEAEMMQGNAGGLIGYNLNSDISDSFSNANVDGILNLGGLIGTSIGSAMENCYSTGNIGNEISSWWNVGGLVGEQYYSTINNCYTTGEIHSSNGAGGLVGFRYFSSIDNSYSTGNIYGYSTGTGGLVGIDVGSFIHNSYSTANIEGHYYVGGLVGYLTYSPPQRDNMIHNKIYENLPRDYDHTKRRERDYFSIYNSYSSGVVRGFSYVGGLSGFFTDYAVLSKSYNTGMINGFGHYVGGLTGTNHNNSVISNSYSTGAVSSSSELWSWAGGLVGENWNSTISNCFSTGSVYGSECTGGLAGENVSGIIEYSYAIGSVSSSTSLVGGLVGCGEGEDTSSYWNIETSGQTESSMGQGRTTAEMTYPYADNTYVDWDFEEIWAADTDHSINDGYPYLRESTVSVDDDYIIVIEHPSLNNYPNPFNPETTIKLNLSQDADRLDLKIYNIRGQLVRTLIDGTPYLRGEYQIVWDGRNDLGQPVTSGIYFCRMTTPNYEKVNKMLLLK
ncbi:MAG: T9SS type A sorting domain-containing protein [Candidatus Cloacimonetes bacterium]|nr:T9SS type A sorting domain-containing protein [Candidatus Cloacimonadota bacterium]